MKKVLLNFVCVALLSNSIIHAQSMSLVNHDPIDSCTTVALHAHDYRNPSLISAGPVVFGSVFYTDVTDLNPPSGIPPLHTLWLGPATANVTGSGWDSVDIILGPGVTITASPSNTTTSTQTSNYNNCANYGRYATWTDDGFGNITVDIY